MSRQKQSDGSDRCGECGRPMRRSVTRRSIARQAAAPMPRPAHSADELLEAVAEYMLATGAVSGVGYEKWRRAQRRPVPARIVILRHFGSWSAAVSLAGSVGA